jgi:hypothetical protein
MSDDSEHYENFTVYTITPADILEHRPTVIPDGQYLARLADDGVGNPSYAVVPYAEDGAPADRIKIGDGRQIYERSADSEDMFMYRARNPKNSGQSWSSHD